MTPNVLLPVDLASEPSWKHALPRALRLAEGGKLHVITVIPNFGMPMVGNFFGEGFVERALHEVGEELTKWVNTHIPEGQEIHPHVVHGKVYHEIISASNRLQVDVIVMGAPPGDLTEYLLGPNAARVVRHATRSVFVVRGV